jgi:hypothetical protein
MPTRFAAFFVVILWSTSLVRAESPAALTERFLIEGKLGAGETALIEILKIDPENSEARFGLGTIQFLRAVERAVQSFHRHGLAAGEMGSLVPFARLPIPPNAKPEPIRYTDLRAILQAWTDDLAKAENTLGRIDQKEVKLPLHFGQIRLDLDGDGTAGVDETLRKLYAQLNASARLATAETSAQFIITFDRGDVAWLRGYCHLLMAISQSFLAFDGQELFNHSASLFYPNPETPFPFLRRAQPRDVNHWDEMYFVDAIAFVHELRLPLSEPARLKTSLAHLESMIALSQESWKFILAETDDDHEWVPNTKQHSVIPGGSVGPEMVKGWLEFLDEAKAILKGEKLVPFWRKGDDRGVNLRRVFTEPSSFDLVLWIQGTAAVPYLEKGKISKPETWRRFQTIFNGQFIGFAFWFN